MKSRMLGRDSWRWHWKDVRDFIVMGFLVGMGFAGATAFWEVVIYTQTGCPK